MKCKVRKLSFDDDDQIDIERRKRQAKIEIARLEGQMAAEKMKLQRIIEQPVMQKLLRILREQHRQNSLRAEHNMTNEISERH